MNLLNVGIDHKTAPLEIRAQFAHRLEELARSLQGLARESIVISTCNRIEIFLVSPFCSTEKILQVWQENSEINFPTDSYFRILWDRHAVRHLFRMAASLESMVVGENEITGQIKRAYELACREGNIGSILHKCFQRAFRVAKGIRAHTEVGRLAVSIPSIGVKLAEKVLGNLQEKRIGIVGLGEIGRIAAEHFASTQPQKLMIWNRTRSVAESLALQLQEEGVRVIVAEDLHQLLNESQILVSAVETSNLFSANDLLKLDQSASLQMILDLSVPASIPKLDFKLLYAFGLDDLKKIAEENSALRLQELEKAEDWIAKDLESFWPSLEMTSLAQTFGRLQSKTNLLTQRELLELRAKLPHLTEQDWLEIEKMAERLTSKVLQDPMMELKSTIETQAEPAPLVEFFRNLFRI